MIFISFVFDSFVFDLSSPIARGGGGHNFTVLGRMLFNPESL
jgi:hypothetical protein